MTENVRHIGAIDAPIIICGGAYSNLEALQAMQAEAGKLGFAPSRIIHTGDVVAYAADPAACAQLLRAWGVHAIQGNVEEQLAANAADCACGFAEGTVCDRLAKGWWAHADSEVNQDLRDWMGALPHQLTFSLNGRRIRVVHGGVTAINRFIYGSDGDEVFAEEFAEADCDCVVGGHCGIPFTRFLGNKLWHNSGALGLPANDGTPRAWFSIFTPLPDGAIRFEHCPLDYDHLEAQRKMRACGLPEDYAQALSSGLLAEGNALSPAEQAKAGLRLNFEPVVWPAGIRQAAE